MYHYRDEHRIAMMARVLGVSESGYYSWLVRKRAGASAKEQADNLLKNKIRRIFHESGQSFGSRKVTHILNLESEEPINHKRVERLMREEGLFSRTHKTYVVTTNSDHQYPLAPDLLKRDFHTTGPGQKTVSDTTYIRTDPGTLYVAVILDLYGRIPIGLAMSTRNNQELVIEALEDAVIRGHAKAGCIAHMDRGSTYASHAYQEKLQKYGFICSMSRKGDCWDNAPMESFWGKLKTEFLKKRYSTIEEAKRAVYEYVWYFYPHCRPHASLGYLTPEQYCKQHLK